MTIPDPRATRRPDPDAESATLSTGTTVPLPLPCVADVAGAVLAVPADALGSTLPADLEPVRIAPGTGTLVVAVVSYRRVADVPPYREFAAIVPAAPVERSTLLAPAFVEGYVAYLPVTTEEAVALGAEVWGYPKERVRIDVDDRGRTREATVIRDGERVVSLAVARPRGLVPVRGTLDSATDSPSGRLRIPVALRGRVGVGRGGVAVELGEGERAEDLRALGLDGATPLARFWAPRLRARIHAGERA